ncbi:MAG: hypothetical protein LRY55_16155 [Leadbetterella sp.]|nr:hypothetical protein [Leadbetterella sp.]
MERYIIEWNGLEITIDYNPNHSEAYRKSCGRSLAHLEIRSEFPNPVSETGYRSHFIEADQIEAQGGVAAYVAAWLAHASQSKQWQKAEPQSRQLTLF